MQYNHFVCILYWEIFGGAQLTVFFQCSFIPETLMNKYVVHTFTCVAIKDFCGVVG